MTTAPTYQPTLADLGEPLHAVTFVVVDLETTGRSAASAQITEFGAVKVRGGEVLAEFQTLVNPGDAIPAQIVRLTGISNSMVATAPQLETVLPAFLEFLGDAVIVAHNAPFDVGFLRSACRLLGYDWPGNEVVDTVQLARRVVPRDEAPNHKLSTLAALFATRVTPDHRALADARATVDVLHALLSRMAPLGVTHRADLAGATARVPDAVRRKHTLADNLPTAPGVYLFRGPRDEILYIGTATNLRRRVRSYFTAAEKRGRMAEMVRLATAVTPVVCATTLEASVREIRLIAEHSPPYNRRSKHPERVHWLRLTAEAHPRLTITRTPPTSTAPHAPNTDAPQDTTGSPGIGPFPSRARAQGAREAVESVLDLRTCTLRLPLEPGLSHACPRADLGRCAAPCVPVDLRPAGTSTNDHAEVVAQVARALDDDPSVVVIALEERMATLARGERYEEATQVRNRLESFLRGADRAVRHRALRAAKISAARRLDDGTWEISVVHEGRLVAAAIARSIHEVPSVAEAAAATAAVVPADKTTRLATLPEETDLIDSWLGQAGVRLLTVEGTLSCPVTAPGRKLTELFGAPGQVDAATHRASKSLAAPESTAAAACS